MSPLYTDSCASVSTPPLEDESAPFGETINFAGRKVVWSPLHVSAAELERWRQIGDDVTDRALAALPGLSSNPTSPSDHPLELIKHHLRTTPTNLQDPDVSAFWTEVTKLPPFVKEEGLKEGKNLNARRSLVEKAVGRGQNVYATYAIPISMALLYFSLAGGFSSPRILRVLELTSYLIGPRSSSTSSSPCMRSSSDAAPSCPFSGPSASSKRTFERLLETQQWVLESMLAPSSKLCPPEGDAALEPRHVAPKDSPALLPDRAWEDTLRVRVLHAQMRAKVLKVAERGGYDASQDGVPINQEDMSATLASFAVAPLWALEEIGFRVSLSEKESYLALWRHIGFYLGVPPPILQRHFGSWPAAEAFLESAIMHLFDLRDPSKADSPAATMARLPAVPVLQSVADHLASEGQEPDYEYHYAIAYTLLGPELSCAVGLPTRHSLRMLLRVRFTFLAMVMPVWFGRLYPRVRWETTRVECFKRGLPRFICRLLGFRRSTFFAAGVVEATGGEKSAGEGRWEEVDSKSESWLEESRVITRMWNDIWREMKIVLTSMGAVSVLGLGLGIWWVYH